MFKAFDNEAKYEALLAGTKLCNVLEAKYNKAFFNS